MAHGKILCGNCHEYHPSTADVRACYGFGPAPAKVATKAPMYGQESFLDAARMEKGLCLCTGAGAAPSIDCPVHKPTERMITPNMVRFLTDLCAERPMWADVENLHADRIPGLTFAAAKHFIEASKAQPKEEAASLEDGVYRDADGTFWMVYHTVHGQNVQVGKRLVITDTGRKDESGATIYEGEFEYVGKKALTRLTPAMRLSEAEAKEFGSVYGFCVRCARTLTRDESKHVGYGATCAGHEGWWYPTKAELKAIKAKVAAA